MKHTTSQRLVSAAIECAERFNIAVNIAIYDSGANLMAFQKMDTAFLGSIDIAQKKGRTAVLFGAPTEALGQLVNEHKLDSFEQTNNGLILFAGGEPIISDHNLIGGIGISGGTAAQDKEIALYAIDCINNNQN